MAKKPHLELVTDEDDPLVTSKHLPAFGIDYDPTHLRRMWQQGRFPVPFKLSSNRNAWKRSVIRKWIADRAGHTE